MKEKTRTPHQKNDFITTVYEAIQEHNEKNETREIFREMKPLARELIMEAQIIKNDAGEIKNRPSRNSCEVKNKIVKSYTNWIEKMEPKTK